MKENLKTILVVLLAIILIGAMSTTVKATYSGKVTMTPEKTTVTPGETITISVYIEDIVDAGTGVNYMEAYYSYDTDFFTGITGTGFTSNSETGYFLLEGNTLTSDGLYAILQLTISENATGTGTLTFTGIKTADGSGAEPTSDDITLTFTVESSTEDDGNTNSAEDDGNTNSNSNTDNTNSNSNSGSTNTNSVSGNNTSNTTSKTSLPNTGIAKGLLIVGGIILVVGIGSYALYKKYPRV